MDILLIGSGAREHALARALKRSAQNPNLHCFGSSRNPGIMQLATTYEVGNVTDVTAIYDFSQKTNARLAIIGPEGPLAAGVADVLWGKGIPCVGPRQGLARLETSKGFTRDLLTRHHISACPRFKLFAKLDGTKEFLKTLGDNYVVKYDGLMGGKGVKVAGDHLHSHEEAFAYCQELVASGGQFVIEEKLIGQEFSLMSFCDGNSLIHMPPVQDHKRAFANDTGPNTGGMGSYSDANHALPFLTSDDIQQAQKINEATVEALRAEFDEKYKGILYGGFMAEKEGVKLIEYNARFGDPEAMNLLALLETDFLEICLAMVSATLHQTKVTFSNKATVCKYAVPDGYPDASVKNQRINVSGVMNKDQLYYASVDERDDGLYEIGSRTIAVVGIADTLAEAEEQAQKEITRVKGPLFHREDIGTEKLIQQRVEHMKQVRS